MLFNSFEFLFLFLPLLVGGYFLLGRRLGAAWGAGWLILGSLIFYSWIGIRHLPILLLSAAFNYLVSIRLHDADRGRARRFLYLGLCGNILWLCYFKYTAFLFENLALAGVHPPYSPPSLPLGISFFTIQQIMFLVDSYEELVDRQPPLRYLLFVCFFPYVIMGPLVHWSEVMPQLARPVKPIGANISRGFFLLALGLFKKAVLADAFSKWADAGFAYSGQLAFADAWITSLAYALQLYFDFCGYTDMALGAAWMLNVQLPHNFSSPYKARSIIEFWQRWHITLTNFITTYLYTPIVRSARKVTFTKAMWATVAAMAIAGLWHGAGWTFVIWGVLHGVALVINHIWRKRKWPVPAPAAWALTFGFVVSDLVFFRSANVPQALSVLHSMFLPRTLASYEPFASLGAAEQAIAAIWILFGVAILLVKPTALDLAEGFRPSPVAAAITAACLVVSTLYVNSVAVKPFIYRDF